MLTKAVKTDTIMHFLNKEFLINENIIGIIENMPGAEIFVDSIENPKGVLVKKDDYMHYLFTMDNSFLDNLCENYLEEGFYGFSGVKGELAEKLRARYLVNWESRCTLYYMPKENLKLSLKKNPTERIRLEDAEIVNKFYQYKDEGSLETIKRDITNRPSSAVYIDGKIASWVLIHDDNSMGIMYTKEEHRCKGYAVDVTIDLAQQIIAYGKTPFVQIVQGNGMSPGLAKKCGFVEAGRADWFGIISGTPKELILGNDKSREQFQKSIPNTLYNIIYNRTTIYKGLYNVLHSFEYIPNDIESLRLVKVENSKSKEDWCNITSKSLNSGDEILSVIEMLLKTVEDPKYNLYVMYKDNIAVAASATLQYEEGERGLYLLSVMPQYEASDFLKLLINETVQAEKNNSCYFIVAQAEERYLDIFIESGFRESHTIKA